jgi:hypothetical protein
MTSRVQIQRSNVAGARPSGRPPGELFVNWADLQLSSIDPSTLSIDLLGVRYFSAQATYKLNDIVANNGGLYSALGTISPGSFNPSQWSAFGGGGVGGGVGEAPIDGQAYARENAGWVVAGSGSGGGGGGGIPEAPIDGHLYGRENAGWVQVPSGTGGGISEAPNDGVLYGRKSLAWAAVPSGTGGLGDAPNDGTTYARNSLAWVHLTHSDITDWASQLASYATTASVTTQLGAYVAKAGDTMAGSLTVTQAAGTAAAFGGGFRVNATGAATWAGTFGAQSADILLSKATSSALCQISGCNNGLLRWQILLGGPQIESGSNSGSGFVIGRCSDAGVSIDSPLQISRGSGATTFSVAIVNGPSDGRLKENVKPIEKALEKVMKLKGVSFKMKDEGSRRQIGLVAQDVEGIVPEVMQEWRRREGDEAYKALDYPKLTALLIEAIKTLTERVIKLEGKA